MNIYISLIVLNSDLGLFRMVQLMGLPTFLWGLITTVICGMILIPVLKFFAARQEVRDDGPSTHLKKSGTLTFGGIMFLIPLIIAGFLAPTFDVFKFLIPKGFTVSPFTAIAVLVFLSGVVGFIDDFIKVRISKKGLSPIAKSVLLLIAIGGFVVYYLWFSGTNPYFLMPFTDLSAGGTHFEVTGFWKIPYGIIIMLVLYFIGNAVNITDGVDGLAASTTIISSVILGIMGAALNSEYSRSASFFSFAIAGSCLGFLFFNRHPARIFMGDTGSQALGAGIAAIAVLMGLFWILLLVGIIYVLEALSVIIQVAYFKKTGKRIFKMAPLHHHFELSGWSEWKVVVVFSLISLCGGLLGLTMVL